MVETQHKIILSTTEPNNHIQLIRIRQGDAKTQKLVVEVVENGKLKTFEGLVPFFINTTKFSENQPIEQKVQEYDGTQGRLVYTLSEPDWQWGGENIAHFSFRSLNGDGTWSEQFSTQDFTYRVVVGLTNSKLRDPIYIWTFEELLRKFREYMEKGANEWEQWVQDNKDILESLDPNGTILGILNDAKGDYDSLAARLDDIQNKTFNVPKGAEQVPIRRDKLFYDRGAYNWVRPTNLDTVIAQADKTKFNMGFMTDIHVDSHQQFADHFDQKDKMERRWNIVGQFRTLETFTDAMVYGGDNIDGYSGGTASGIYPYTEQERRAKNLHVLKRFASVATAGAEVPIILCRGNHETGKIPYANDGRSRLDSLTGSDIAVAYDSRYGPNLFPNKKVAIYRIDTDDFEDHTNSQGKFIEFSGYYNGAEFPHGKLGQNQLHAFGQWLEQLDRSYHVVIVGHVPMERENDVANVTKLGTLLDGFKQGASVTIDYNSMQGYNPNPIGQKTYNFTTKGRGTVAAIFAGHWHYETVKQLGTTQIIVCTTGYCELENYDTDKEAGFANVQIDTEKRTIKVQGVGHYTNRNFTY
ncbi:BppU family phage baseplate upper protein [Enterococcus faecium]|nr:BppU family phage baseplate upper protein [Enterococcus faecium]